MIPSTALLALSLPLALAQYGGGAPPAASSSAPASVAPTSASSPSVPLQTVTVGQNNALAFSPNTITAAVGSEVEFVFYAPSHSVVQAAFDAPCVPINNTGFFSGAMTTTGSGPNANSFTITINDTTPLWVFCGFPGHCEAGMVLAINENSASNNTFAAFQAAAMKVGSTTEPTFGPQGGVIGPVKAASSPSTTSAAPASSQTAKAGANELRGSMLWAGLFVTALTGWTVAELMG